MSLPRLVASACPLEDDIACFIEGRASPSTTLRLQSHLDVCESCRRLLVGALRSDDPPTGTALRVGGPRTFAVGELLQDRYQIVSFIARGGMGEVYEARDLQLDETVALKTIVCTDLDDDRLLPRIRAEVLLARRITHTNVCRILEFGLFERRRRDAREIIPYFTMEFLRGETLKQYASRRGPLDLAEVLPIAQQILKGLEAVHAAGIVHRDLKPENVCIVVDGTSAMRVVVMDFGLARSTHGTESTRSINAAAGTPAYMAPEQALGGSPSTAWDIYAMGIMLFELVAGAQPFSGGNSIAAALARIHADAPALSSVRRGIHPRFEAVVARCLQRDPRRRFASAKQVCQALENITAAARVQRATTAKLRLPRSSIFAAMAVLGVSWLRPALHHDAPLATTSLQRLSAHGWQHHTVDRVVERTVARVGTFSFRLAQRPSTGSTWANSRLGGRAPNATKRLASGPGVGHRERHGDGAANTSDVPPVNGSTNEPRRSLTDDLLVPSFAALARDANKVVAP